MENPDNLGSGENSNPLASDALNSDAPNLDQAPNLTQVALTSAVLPNLPMDDGADEWLSSSTFSSSNASTSAATHSVEMNTAESRSTASASTMAQVPVNPVQTWYETEPLLLAVEKRDREAVRHLIAANVDLTVQNNLGHNALALAAFTGDLEMVKLLHEAGVPLIPHVRMNVDGSWESGIRPLFLAAYNGHFLVIDYLIDGLEKTGKFSEEIFLEKGAVQGIAISVNGNALWPARPPLPASGLELSQYQDMTLVEWILSVKPDLSFIKKLKDWALTKSPGFCKNFFAGALVLAHQFELVEMLYDWASDEDKKKSLVSLFEAGGMGEAEIKILKYFLMRLETEGKDEKILMQVVFKIPADDEDSNHAEDSPRYSILQAALSSNEFNHTPKEFKCLLFWLKRKKNLVFKHQFFNLKSTQGDTVLIMACRGRYSHVVTALIEAGVSVGTKNDDSQDPLRALMAGPQNDWDYLETDLEKQTLLILLKHGVYLDVVGEDAVFKKIKQALLKRKSADNNLNILSAAFSLLILAGQLILGSQPEDFDYCGNGNPYDSENTSFDDKQASRRIQWVPSFEYFLAKLHDSLNARRKTDGNTALHLAIVNNKPGLTALLLKGGASVDLPNDVGLTPLHLGLQSANPFVRSLFYIRALRRHFKLEAQTADIHVTEIEETENDEEQLQVSSGEPQRSQRGGEIKELKEAEEPKEIQEQTEIKTRVEFQNTEGAYKLSDDDIKAYKKFVIETLAKEDVDEARKHFLMFEWGCLVASPEAGVQDLELSCFDPVQAYQFLNQVPRDDQRQYKIAHAKIFDLLMGKHLKVEIQDLKDRREALESLDSQDNPNTSALQETGTVSFTFLGQTYCISRDPAKSVPTSPVMLRLEIKHYLYSGKKDVCPLNKLVGQYIWDHKPTDAEVVKGMQGLDGFKELDADSYLALIDELKETSRLQQAANLPEKLAGQETKQAAEIEVLRALNAQQADTIHQQSSTIARLHAELERLQTGTLMGVSSAAASSTAATAEVPAARPVIPLYDSTVNPEIAGSSTASQGPPSKKQKT